MANIQHSVLTDPQIHEPKGVSTAASGKVYRANGSGSGAWVFPSGHSYGELYIDNGITSQTLSAASAKAKLNPATEWTANGSANVTLSAANGEITVTEPGEYQLNFWVSFNTAAIAAGAKYYFHYAVNGTASARRVVVAKYTNGTDLLTCSVTGFASLADNDVVSIHVGGDGTSSSTAITVLEAGFSLSLIDPA
jgi:hypothetical protein